MYQDKEYETKMSKEQFQQQATENFNGLFMKSIRMAHKNRNK